MAEQEMSLKKIIETLKRGGPTDKLNLDQVDERGATPLGRVCASGALEDVELLLKHGADPNAAPGGQLHPLVSAMTYFAGRDDRADVVKVAKMMLGAGLDVNFAKDDKSLLVEAAHYDLPELCSFLIENGADIGSKAGQGRTALAVAQSAGSLDSLRVLCRYLGEDYDALVGSSQMTLEDILGIFSGGDIDSRDKIGNTSLHIAAEHGAAHLVRELTRLGADIEAKNNGGDTPLFSALNGNIEAKKAIATIDALVAAGADLNALNGKGQTVLGKAKAQPSLRALAAHLEQLGAK